MGTYVVDVGIVVDAESPGEACKEVITRMDGTAEISDAILDWWHEGHEECTAIIVEGGGVQKIYTPDETDIVIIDKDLRRDGDVTRYRVPVVRGSKKGSDGKWYVPQTGRADGTEYHFE